MEKTPLTKRRKILYGVFLIFMLSLGMFVLLSSFLYFNRPDAIPKIESKKVPIQEEEREKPRRRREFPPVPRALALTEAGELGAIFLSMENMEALEERREGSHFQKVKVAGIVNSNVHKSASSVLFEFFGNVDDRFFFLTKLTFSGNGSPMPVEEYFPIQTHESGKMADVRTLIEEIGGYINTCGGYEEEELSLFCKSGHLVKSYDVYCRVARTKEGISGAFVFVPEKYLLFLHTLGQKI